MQVNEQFLLYKTQKRWESDATDHPVATSTYRWRNSSGIQSLSCIRDQLSRLNGQHVGLWQMSCRLYRPKEGLQNATQTSVAPSPLSSLSSLSTPTSLSNPTQSPMQSSHALYVLTNVSNKCCHIAIDGTYTFISGRLDAIISKLKNLWTLRQLATIEVWLATKY